MEFTQLPEETQLHIRELRSENAKWRKRAKDQAELIEALAARLVLEGK